MRFILSIAFLFHFCVSVVSAQSSKFDYESMPRMDYTFADIHLQLNFNPDSGSLNGIARYQIAAYSRQSAPLTMHAYGLQVDSVFINDTLAEFESRNDRLTIQIPDSEKNPQRFFEMEAHYSAKPDNGLLRTIQGTWFTSTIPFSRANWFPVLEHPSIEVTYNFEMRVPEGYQVVSNGFPEDENTTGDGYSTFQWVSSGTIPVSEIGFVAGKLKKSESLMGVKAIHLYVEEGALDDEIENSFIRDIQLHLANTQRTLRNEYPYDALSIIVLNDHLWEPKAYLASIGFVYKNAGEMAEQMKYVIDAQWFGVYQRSAVWNQIVTQSVVLAAMQSYSKQTINEYPESSFSEWKSSQPLFWSDIIDFVANLSELERNSIRESLPILLSRKSGIFEWNEYARVWHQLSGRSISKPGSEYTKEIKPREEHLVEVFIEYNSNEEHVRLTVDPGSGLVRNDDIPFIYSINSSSGVSSDTLVAESTGGEFTIQSSTSPQNVLIKSLEGSPIRFIERKGFSMWLHQLKNASSTEDRTSAAQEMARFKDDPDIQLALTDYLRSEQDSAVRAAIIRSLSDVVQGASGTEQTFLGILRSGKGEELQAAVEALYYYPENQDAISAVARVAMNSNDTGAVIAAISTFRHIATENQFRELGTSILLGNRLPEIKAALLEELFKTDDMDIAIGTALDILEDDFPYAMREKSIELLVRYNQESELNSVLLELAEDYDPRIRALAVKYANALEPRLMNDLLEERYIKERDPRVRALFDEL